MSVGVPTSPALQDVYQHVRALALRPVVFLFCVTLEQEPALVRRRALLRRMRWLVSWWGCGLGHHHPFNPGEDRGRLLFFLVFFAFDDRCVSVFAHIRPPKIFFHCAVAGGMPSAFVAFLAPFVVPEVLVFAGCVTAARGGLRAASTFAARSSSS